MAESLITPLSQTPRAREDDVQPLPGAEAPPDEGSSNLPDELLQMPALQALFSGEPPAISAPLQEFSKRPEAKLIVQNKDPLMEAGIALYRSLDGATGVIFNQFYVSPEDIKAADNAGRLAEIAPPFDAVSTQVGQSGANNPVLRPKQVPQGLATASISPPPQLPGPATAGQRQIVSQRAKNLSTGGPTTGPKPGAGRLLNSLLRPAV